MNTELAWAAGFFDGEGSSYLRTYTKPTTGWVGRYPGVTLSQKERQPIERFVAAVGEGRVRGPYKGLHAWSVEGTKAERVFEKLCPYLSEPKLAQWASVLERLCRG